MNYTKHVRKKSQFYIKSEKIEENELFPKSFHVASITLKPKITMLWKYKQTELELNIPHEYRCNHLNKILRNQIQQHIKKLQQIMTKWGLSYEYRLV